jgi:hypothetical protein
MVVKKQSGKQERPEKDACVKKRVLFPQTNTSLLEECCWKGLTRKTGLIMVRQFVQEARNEVGATLAGRE